jgi:hypothetical protein
MRLAHDIELFVLQRRHVMPFSKLRTGISPASPTAPMSPHTIEAKLR